ncbi:MAG: hypothetical protein ACJAV6_000231 [Candidatus Paceibacteria bacterium]|jgi:hypothetical protein
METPNFNKKQESEPNRLTLAMELIESNETLSFPGLNIESYNTLKAEEEEYPGFATPIDEIIKKCEEQGIKIEIGKNPDGSNMFLLPKDSDDIDDSLRFKHLNLDAIDNEKLKQLASL